MKRWIPFILILNLTACAAIYEHSHQVDALKSSLSKSAALQIAHAAVKQPSGFCLVNGGAKHIGGNGLAKLVSFDGDVIRYTAHIDFLVSDSSITTSYTAVHVYHSQPLLSEEMDLELNITQLTTIRIDRTKEPGIACNSTAAPGTYLVRVFAKKDEELIPKTWIMLAFEPNRQDDVDKLVAALLVLSPSAKVFQE